LTRNKEAFLCHEHVLDSIWIIQRVEQEPKSYIIWNGTQIKLNLISGEIRRGEDPFAGDRGGEEVVANDFGQKVSRNLGSGLYL
jgi:hypothetical protein